MSVFDTLTTRMPNGVTNAAPWQTMGAAGADDPTWNHLYHNDFDTYASGDWTTTVVGSGTAALTDFDGGALLLSTSAGASDSVGMQLKNATFQLDAGKATFVKFAGQLSDLNATTFVGLVQKGATTLASVTDGILLSIAPTTGLITLRSRNASVETAVALPTASAVVAGTYFELGLMVDWQGNLAAFFNPTTGRNPISAANAAAGQARGRVAALYTDLTTNPSASQSTGLTVSQVLLTPMVSITNGSAAIRTLTVDYLTVARER